MLKNKLYLVAALLPAWIVIYNYLEKLTNLLVDDVLGLPKGNHLTETLRFFIFEVPKVMLLLILIIFFVGIIRSYFTPERTRKALEGKRTFTGNIMAASLGIVTPFCSCSAIPLFLGFVESGVPLGITFSFLIAAPMINEVAIVLLYGMFGWKTALIYITTGLSIAIVAGWIIGKLNPEKWVEDWVYKIKTEQTEEEEAKPDFRARIEIAIQSVKEIVSKVWLYVVLGIGVGAGVHGYVPADFMASLMGKDVWYAVPLAVLTGIPLYSNAAGIVPIVSVLIQKGASLGTALAFMMSVIALSLPEMIILRKVLKIQFIITFAAIVGAGIILVGYIFNSVF